eukprot:m51a1_g9961 putative arp2 3 complex + actin related protein (588) ;mRNA; r:62798-70065
MFHCPTKYECQNCHRTFASPQALGGHRAHPCQPEGSRRGSRSRCDSESSGDEDDYVCCDCGRAFASPQALGGHRAHPCQPEGSRRGRRSCCVSDSSSSSSSSECEYEYECCDCGRAFETQQGLNGHKAHCRPQQARATPSRRPAGDCTAGAFECPCGRTFESQRGLSGHRAHCKAQARPQTQPRCTGDAAGRRSGGAFECPCGRTFESQQGLSGHRAHCRAQARPQLQLQPQRPGPVHYAFDSARVYSSGGAFKCPCGRSFESQQGLSGHRAHCTAEYPKDAPDGYECPACDRVFATEEEFWTHWVHCGGAPDTKSRSKASGARFVSDVAETSSSVIAVLVRSSFKPKGSCVDESKALLSFFMDKVPDLDAAHIIRGCRGTAECIKRRKEARALPTMSKTISGAFHSQYNEPMEKGAPVPFPNTRYICNFPILGVRPTKNKAPAGVPPCDADKEDIVDESIRLFKANVMFRNFEVKGYADRLLIYITVYLSSCLPKLLHKSKGEAEKILFAYAIEPFSLPGDKTFCLGGLVTAPANRSDSEFIKQYLTYLRQEAGTRLLERVYEHGDREPDKWWMCFNKRKFLNKSI